jgi:DNA-binding transcriptional regulator YiaG
MSNKVFACSFTRAAEKLGGAGELAAFLQTSVDTVEHWLRGTMRPPVSAFLRVVDLITSKNPFDPYGR